MKSASHNHSHKKGGGGGGSKSHKSSKKSSSTKNNNNFSYAGVHPSSVKCYWEQHNSQETECTDEVFVKVAEDATYKLWELGNALKIYARHSAGRVTTDLVNDVLRDMNVAPVLGANSSNWDTVEYDGSYYFNSDRVVNLREEYLRDYRMAQPGPTSVTSTWVAEDEISDDLLDLNDKLCDAIFLGDEETFTVALEVASSHPFLCGILGLVLNKCTEMLAFDYRRETLNRTMQLLAAMTGNSFLGQSNVQLELYYLSQILISLVLGADNDKYFENKADGTDDIFIGQAQETTAMQSVEQQAQVMTQAASKEESPELTSFTTNIDASHLIYNPEANLFNGEPQQQDTQPSTEIQLMAAGEVVMDKKATTDVFNGEATVMKNQYEDLIIMMENDGFELKKEDVLGNLTEGFVTAAGTGGESQVTSGRLQILTETTNFDQSEPVKVLVPMDGPAAGVDQKVIINQTNSALGQETGEETEEDEDNEEEEVYNAQEGGADAEKNEEFCIITTKMCDIKDVPLVCQCLGRLVGFWPYMYRESGHQLLKRIEQFFLNGVILLKCEYEWLVRAVQAVFALGEVPFREFSVYLDKLHPAITPEWVTIHFNCCGVFLKGAADHELYELLYELCGDAILPFMLYRFPHLQQLEAIRRKAAAAAYKIVSIVKLKWLEVDAAPCKRSNAGSAISQFFTDRVPLIRSSSGSRIGIKFSGCRPLPLKPLSQRAHGQPLLENVCGTTGSSTTRSRIIVARRKALRPLSNVPQLPLVYDISGFNL